MSECDPGALALRGLSVLLGRQRLFAPVELSIPAGVVATLMGPSGVGKSSLLAHLCGALDPALRGEGRVLVDGRDVTDLPTEARRIGILFQEPLLFPHLSVAGNLAFGLPAHIRGRRHRREQVLAALGAAGLEGLADRDPATLSGGQKARIAVLRALLAEPLALLLDEPFAGLDLATREGFRALVLAELRQRNLPTLLVTHDEGDARAAGGPVVHLVPASPDSAPSDTAPSDTAPSDGGAPGPKGSGKSPL